MIIIQERRNKDYLAKNFISRLNKEKSQRTRRRNDENNKAVVDRLSSVGIVDNLFQKIDKMKINQINLEDLKLFGVNLNIHEDLIYKPQAEDLYLPPINKFKNSSNSHGKKDVKKKRYSNYIGENLLF